MYQYELSIWIIVNSKKKSWIIKWENVFFVVFRFVIFRVLVVFLRYQTYHKTKEQEKEVMYIYVCTFIFLSTIHTVHIYIYIYIYIYPQTDCFVVLQLFSVAGHARCFKLGSKSGWLYVSSTSYSRPIVILSVSEGIFCKSIFTYSQSVTGMLNSWEEFSIYAYVAASNSALKCSTHEHIYFHPKQTVSLYHNSSVWFDTRDFSRVWVWMWSSVI